MDKTLTETTYSNVAKQCSAYSVKESGCTNKSGDNDMSCTTCKHFAKDNHCKLDLLDPIVENHDF